MTAAEPVRVRVYLSTNWVGADDEESIEIDRTEWDAMSPVERREFLDECASVFVGNLIEYGWIVDDESDYAATQDGGR